MQNAQATQAAQAAPPATAAPQPQIVPPPVAAQPPLPEAAPPAEAAPLADVLPAAGPGIADPWEGLTALSLDAIQTPAVPSIESAIPPEQAALAMPQPAKPQHRPLLIPNDFDPFAPPPQQARQQEEGWAGLPSQGTGDLIQQRHDGMVHTLPLKGLSTEALHDASHTGLPSCFEQSQKLDPACAVRPGRPAPRCAAAAAGLGPGLRTGPGLQSAAHAIACTARRAGATAGGGSTGPACTPACDRYRDSCSAGAASCTGGGTGTGTDEGTGAGTGHSGCCACPGARAPDPRRAGRAGRSAAHQWTGSGPLQVRSCPCCARRQGCRCRCLGSPP